mgnify:FL=1
MKAKKILSLALVGLLAIAGLSACSGENNASKSGDGDKLEKVTCP